MYCKTKYLFGFQGEGEERRCCFVCWKPPPKCYCFVVFGSLPWSFISVISRAGGEVVNLPPMNSKQAGLQFCFFSAFICSSILSQLGVVQQFIIMALIAQTVHDNSLCLMSKVYIIYTIYRTLNPAYSPVSAIDNQDCYYPSTLPGS